MGKRKISRDPSSLIAANKKARYHYFIETSFEAGLVLEGWEVKSLRDKRVQLTESYVTMRDGEAWLIGAHISPLKTVAKYSNPNPTRERKLLLHRKELSQLVGAVERRGYTLVPLKMFWQYGRAKLEIGTAKGKKQYDKRQTERERDWNREKQRTLRQINR